MITIAETTRSMRGVWELFRNQRDGMFFFDISVEGFWRSFQAILLVIPSYAVVIWIERMVVLRAAAAVDPDQVAVFVPDAGMFVVAHAVKLVAIWVALPIILAAGAQPLGFSDRFAAFIVARNWGLVFTTAMQAVAALFFLLTFMGDTFAAFVSLLALVLALRYEFMVARHALKLRPGWAIFLVAFAFVLTLLIDNAGDVLFGLNGPAAALGASEPAGSP